MNSHDHISDLPTEEILTELFSRFDHCCFIGGSYDTQESSFIKRSWKGNPHMIAGLAMDLAGLVIQQHHDEARPVR